MSETKELTEIKKLEEYKQRASKLANPKCKDCYGRGYYIANGKYYLCHCAAKNKNWLYVATRNYLKYFLPV